MVTVVVPRNVLCLLTLVLGLLTIPATSSWADLYGGSLSYSTSGLLAGGYWVPTLGEAGSSITWTVTPISTGYHYQYELTLPDITHSPAASHFIIEVSENFTSNDFSNVIWDGSASGLIELVDAPGASPSNPGMPSGGDWNDGLKINSPLGFGDLTLTLQFDSPRVPVWGDFYAKGGSGSYVYNTGLGLPDADDGRHIAVPDSVAPVPAAAILGLLGLGSAGYLLRRLA